ncbi:MAG: replication protein RepA [Frankiaceae bacterium]
MPRRDVAKWIDEAVALEVEDAAATGAVGYMGRVLVQTTLPHSSAGAGPYYERTNGKLTLTIMAPPRRGVPYGTYPRLVLAWLTTEAVRTRSRQVVLGDTLSEWLRELGLPRTGGARGTIARLHDQMRRLFAATISVTYDNDRVSTEAGMRVADASVLWWDPKHPDDAGLWESVVTLSERFFDEVTSRPVPISVQALHHLKGSPLRLDLYCWLTYRMATLRRPTTIPWEALALQFGGDYRRIRDFKAKLLQHLPYVLAVYRDAHVEDTAAGLLLRPSPTHIPPRAAQLLPGV